MSGDLGALRRKLVEGTEVLRTGGGASLAAAECNALLDMLAISLDALEDPGAAFPWESALRDLRKFHSRAPQPDRGQS